LFFLRVAAMSLVEKTCIRDSYFVKKIIHVQRSSADTRPVLVFVTYTGLGDLLMALPLLVSLKDRFYVLPVVKSSDQDLAQLLCEDGLLEGYLAVNESLRFHENPTGQMKLCFALSRLRPDVVLVYGKRLLAAAAYVGLLRAGRILFCIPYGLKLPRAPRFESLAPTGNQTSDYLQFAKKLGVHSEITSVQLTRRSKERLRQALPAQIKWPSYAVVAPWTSDRRREAPLHFFGQCIEMIIRDGALPVVLTGMLQNRAEAKSLLSKIPPERVRDVTGETDTKQLLALLLGARFLLANDSGNLHLAALAGTRAIAAFGPSAPQQIVSRDALDRLATVSLGLSCSPCFRTSHAYRCPGAYLQCLRGLAASDARSLLLEACRSGEAASQRSEDRPSP
jgi:ADP-heptose:LPS heptosyltransferase